MSRLEKNSHDSSGPDNTDFLSLPLEVLQLQPPNLVGSGATIRHVMDLMREKNVPAVLVCESKDGPIQGIFTERDALRVYKLGWNPDERTIREIMRPDPFCFGPWDSVGFALKKLVNADCPYLPIIDLDGRPAGLLNRSQLLSFMSDRRSSVSVPAQNQQDGKRNRGASRTV